MPGSILKGYKGPFHLTSTASPPMDEVSKILPPPPLRKKDQSADAKYPLEISPHLRNDSGVTLQKKSSIGGWWTLNGMAQSFSTF
jgi:hypothetical protein